MSGAKTLPGGRTVERAFARSEKSGDLTSVREVITTQLATGQLDENNGVEALMMLALQSRDTAAVSHILLSKHPSLGWNTIVYPDAWFEALAARIRGDNNTAVRAFAIARPEMESRVNATPTNGVKLSVLAVIDAGLRRKEQAIDQGERARGLTPFKANNFDACTVRSNLAVVYAWTGENDLAISELSNLADRPASGSGISRVTYGDLQLNPVWDPLRSDPRFQSLVKRLAPVGPR